MGRRGLLNFFAKFGRGDLTPPTPPDVDESSPVSFFFKRIATRKEAVVSRASTPAPSSRGLVLALKLRCAFKVKKDHRLDSSNFYWAILLINYSSPEAGRSEVLGDSASARSLWPTSEPLRSNQLTQRANYTDPPSTEPMAA